MINTGKNENSTTIEILYNAFNILENLKGIDDDAMYEIVEASNNICVAVGQIKSQNENDQRLKLKLGEYYLLCGQEPSESQATALKLFNSLVDVDK